MIEGTWANIYSSLSYMTVNSSNSTALKMFQASSQNCSLRGCELLYSAHSLGGRKILRYQTELITLDFRNTTISNN